MKEKIAILLQLFPQSYAEELGIDLKSRKPAEIFKWFLASILFAHRIPESIAKSTYKEFEREGVVTPERILKRGWDDLVRILDAGRYVRYDFSTASALLAIMEKLKNEYGSLENLYAQCKDEKELEAKLREFKRIGPTTVNIFFRELRDIWKVDPLPSKFTLIAAKNLKLIKSSSAGKALKELKRLWKKYGIRGKSFVNFETALLRLGKNYCLKNKCSICELQSFCSK